MQVAPTEVPAIAVVSAQRNLRASFSLPWGLQVAVEPAHDEAYLAWRLETDLRAPYWSVLPFFQ
jgi:hypothetical protein